MFENTQNLGGIISMNNKQNLKQFNILEILLYHLLPGVPILLFAILFANPNWGAGLSIYMSLMLAILFGLIPVQLGILFYHAKKSKRSIKDLILFKDQKSLKKTLLWAIPCLIISFLIFGIVAPKEHTIWTIFNWIPSWFRLDLFSITAIPRSELGITLTLGVILNGVAGPFVEELYFRGFLLPRMEKLGKLAPFINVVLFSLYHLFTPWENITRILALTPYIYGVWKKQNIRIGMVVHLTLNTLSMVGMILLVL